MIGLPGDLDRELRDALDALGLVTADGSLDASWFGDPLARVETIVTNAPQRAALERLLSAVLPPETQPSGERWHPVLSGAGGGFFLTVNDSNEASTWGAAARLQGSTASLPEIDLRIRAPLIALDPGGVRSVVASAGTPLTAEIRIGVPSGGIDGVRLSAIRAGVHLEGGAHGFAATLEGLDLGDGRGARDVSMDPANLSADALDVLVALGRTAIAETTAAAGPAREAIVSHLMPLLGFDAAGVVPPLALADLAKGPDALRAWIRALASGGGAGAKAWLGHLAGLLQGTDIAVTGDGTPEAPWELVLAMLPGGSRLSLSLTASADSLDAGLGLRLAPAGTNPAAALAFDAIVLSIPFAASTSIRALPQYSIVALAPGDDTTWLAGGTTSSFGVRQLRAGLRGAPAPEPLLELAQVRIDGSEHTLLDLGSTNAVAGAAQALLRDAIQAAVGASPTAGHLLALAGIVPPVTDPASPNALDLGAFAARPLAALGAVHRRALLDPAHPWSALFAELTALAGFASAVTGSGTADDPWQALHASLDPLTIDLVAWNADATGHPRLRLALRASASWDPVAVQWLCELLAIDFAADGAPTFSLSGAQHLQIALSPLPLPDSLPGIGISASSLTASLAWSPQQGASGNASLSGLQVTTGSQTIAVPAIRFPPAPSDPAHPEAAFGVDAAVFDALLRALLGRAAISWGGATGFALAGLLGLHGSLAGVPDAWPALRAGSGAPSILADPGAALEDLLQRLTASPAAKMPFLPSVIDWLRGIVGDALPARLADPLDASVGGGGIGAPDNPWTLPLKGSEASLAVWLEPAGVPGSFASWLAPVIASAAGLPALLDCAWALAKFDSRTASALSATDPQRLGAALAGLADELQTGDGVVPYRSALPAVAAWQQGQRLRTAHAATPADPAAISQILDRVDSLSPGARTGVLVSPSFAEGTPWSALLTAAAARGHAVETAAAIDLRVPGVSPLQVSLDALPANSDWYVVVLAPETADAAAEAQLARVVATIATLRAGARVCLVGHSTAGLAARSFVVGSPASVAGLITVATPLGGAPLVPLRNPQLAEAIRVLQALGPIGTPGGGLATAFDTLVRGLDGWEQDSSTLPPRPSTLPWNEFAGGSGLDTGGVPALALASALDEPLIEALRNALSARVAALAATTATPPTHLAIGVRAPVPLPAIHPGEVHVDLAATGELFRLALGTPKLQVTRGTRVLVDASLSRDGAWLVGTAGARSDPTAAGDEMRVREARLVFSYVSGADPAAAVQARQVMHRGVTAEVVALGDALSEPVLGAIGQALDPIATAGSSAIAGAAAGALSDALVALGIGVRTSGGPFSVSTDALASLRVAPGPFLSSRLAAALGSGSGVLGFNGPPSGPWTQSGALLAIESAGGLVLRIGVGETQPLTLADAATLAIDARWDGGPATLSIDAGVGAAALSWKADSETLVFSTGGLVAPLTLWPSPAPAALQSWIASSAPRLLLSAAASAFIESVVGPGVRIGAIHALLESPRRSLARPGALGDGTRFDPAQIRGLFTDLAGFLAPSPAAATPQAPTTSPSIPLPAGLRLSVDDGPDLRLRLATDAPIAGAIDIALTAEIDSSFGVKPGGKIGIQLALPASPWTSLGIVFQVDGSGISLVLSPGDGSTPIRLLPTFGGFGALGAALEALLPRVLDSLVGALGTPLPTPATIALDLAAALGVYDTAGGFAAHADALRGLTTPGAFARVQTSARAGIAAAIARVFTDPGSPLAGSIPGSVALADGLVRWTLPSMPGGAGSLALAFGWDNAGPRAEAIFDGVRLAGAATIGASMTHAAGQTAVAAALDLDLLPTLGLAVAPRLALTGAGAGDLAVHLLPLGAGTDGIIDVALAPQPGVTLGSGAGAPLAEVAGTLAGNAILRRVGSSLDTAIAPGAPTVRALLAAGGLLDPTSPDPRLAHPLPAPLSALAGALGAIAAAPASGVTIGSATLSFVDDARGVGLRLSGSAQFDVGSFRVRALFSPRDAALADANGGIRIDLATRDPATRAVALHPRLRAVGTGMELGRPGGDALLSAGAFRLGRVAAYVFLDVALASGDTPAEPLGAALALDGVGIPLGLATGSGSSGGNPVASSLLRGDGVTSDTPDSQASAAPTVDLLVARRAGNTTFRIEGATAPLWIDVERSFGPLQIARLGVEPGAGPSARLLVDGGVKIAGLTVQVDELSVAFALADVLHPDAWSIDLAGLALAFSSGGFSLAGGLRRTAGPPVEYDGILLFEGAGRTITAVGSYARPSDAAGGYTSFFAFVTIPWTIGGPPFLFITGLAAGAGYNRQLLLPAAVDDIPAHPLLQALDAGAISSDPMTALRAMSELIPSRRGSFWIAAGARFTSFGLVQSRAIVVLSLGGDVQITVMGVSQLILPSADNALVSIELALKARFSVAELVLSVQAQLTDHSWIYSPAVQLTGGFAFFAWFKTGVVVFTMGGYSPHFARPSDFPIVPRLGFRWKPTDSAVATGTAYFALTTSCVMAGGSLSFDYQSGGVHAWFTAAANILVSWDPLAYDFDVSVELGASYSFEVCFIECANVTLSFDLGAKLRLRGPPLAAEVTLDLDVTSVTVSFGSVDAVPGYLPDWASFAERYLFAGDAAREGVRALLAEGLERADPSAPAPAGDASAPWPVGPEITFAIETRMPAQAHAFQGSALVPLAGADVLDLAPMGDAHVQSSTLGIVLERQNGSSFAAVAVDPWRFAVEQTDGPVPEATWRFHAPQDLAASANNLRALVGATLRLEAIGVDPSGVIAIATLATDDPTRARPLPLARASPSDLAALRSAGVAAESLAVVGAAAPAGSAARLADAVLSSDPRFAARRAASGLASKGLDVGARSSLARRSAPPFVAPLSSGLTMRAPGLAAPPTRAAVNVPAPVALSAPRLRSLVRRAAVVSAGPATRTVSPGILVRSAETGTGAGAAHTRVIADLESNATSHGVTIPAGVTQIWDVPAASHRLVASGTSQLRAVSLGSGNTVLGDVTLSPSAAAASLAIAPGTRRVALTALGAPALVPGTASPVRAGWMATQHAVQIASRLALVPGARILLPRDARGSSEGLLPVSTLVASSPGLQTVFPSSPAVLAALLDEVDPTAASRGDVVVSVRGATAGAPVRLSSPRRRALLYTLTPLAQAAEIAVTLASRQGFRIAGLFTLSGDAASNAKWLASAGLALAFPEVPGGASGDVLVRFEQGG
jgi:hypothetical protein